MGPWKLLCTALAAGTPLLAASPAVRLAGTVTSGGKPLAGANVSLKGVVGLVTLSEATGTFLLASSPATGILRSSSLLGARVEGGTLLLPTAAGTGTIAIEAFAADGRRILSRTVPAGTVAALPSAALAPGLNRLRVRGEGCLSVLRVGDALRVVGQAQRAEHGGAARATAAVDTLIVSKTGFVEKRIPVASYADTEISVVMDSAGACPEPKAGTSRSNPIFTDVYTADPAVMVDGCTFYVQCGHDQGVGGFDLREWYLLKSTDMVNWTRTTPMTLKTFGWTNANAWAGQMIKARNGKYYWYVPINDVKYSQDRMAIGVAVADHPEGPWKDALGKPLINDSLEMATWGVTNIDQTPHTIDPTVFIDDDGEAYLQYGGFWRMITVKLNPDMISLAGKLTETTPPDYFESPYLIKRGKTYYEIYAHGGANPTTIDYATSSSPMGPWTHRGTILDTMPRVPGQDASTNHAGVGLFAGQWYIVYHVSNGPNDGGAYRREVAIDKLTFDADGTIRKVTPSPALHF